jgi:hypothetical protein
MYIFYKTMPHLEGNCDNDWLHLIEDWCFYIDDKPVWIPAGYEYDGASIPRIFWSIIGSPFEPRLQAAALAHDWIYLTHIYSRALADEVIYQLTIRSKVNTVKAHIIWAAVRSCGYLPYQNNEKDRAILNNLIQQIKCRPDGNKFLS